MTDELVNNDVHAAVRQIVLVALRSGQNITTIINALHTTTTDLRAMQPLLNAALEARSAP